MVLLPHPALTLNIGVQDILGILEDILKEKNWTNFEVANLKLVYTPYFLFNYDTLVEADIGGQAYSQGFSGLMAMNAVTGELEPTLTQIMESQPVSYEKEPSHDLQYELETPVFSNEEVKEAAKLKMAGQFNLPRKAVSITGIRVIYWPTWKVFVSLPRRTQRMDVDAVSGFPLNFEQVPTREKTWLEVSKETIGKMKTPGGWAEISKKAVAGAAKGGKVAAKGGSGAGGTLDWLIHSNTGRYALLAMLGLIVVIVFLYS